MTAPALDTPTDDEQLSTLRPELTVKNGTTNQPTGTRTYEFQIADNTGFSPVAISGTGIAENAAGKTSFTPAQDLQPTTRMYWRARMVQGTTNSDWSATGKFKTRLVGFNRPGELYDPLVNGETIGSIGGSGNITWMPGQGIRLNDALAYVVYDLPQVVLTGELSVEVSGLGPGGPCCKVRVFSILDRVGVLSSSSSYSMNAQYRGVNGNPDNCICFKSIFGNNAARAGADHGPAFGYVLRARSIEGVSLAGGVDQGLVSVDRERRWGDGPSDLRLRHTVRVRPTGTRRRCSRSSAPTTGDSTRWTAP